VHLYAPLTIVGRATLKMLQKKKAICKTRAQCAKHNCAFELFKAHCAATNNAENANFHKKF
jgi:hypothetical protein